MCDCDYRDAYDEHMTRGEMIRELVEDCSDASALLELVLDVRAEFRRQQRLARAPRPAPPPPAPFISVHTRNFTTGEDLGTVIVMQDRPKTSDNTHD